MPLSTIMAIKVKKTTDVNILISGQNRLLDMLRFNLFLLQVLDGDTERANGLCEPASYDKISQANYYIRSIVE